MSVDQRPDGVPPPSGATLRWVREVTGPGALVASVRLMGVDSTTLHAVDVLSATGVLHRLALRRFHRTDRLRTDPWYAPANEATVLGLLGSTDVPAPRLVAADTAPTMCDVPTLLTTRVPGSPPVHADRTVLAQLAETLALVHAVDLPVVRALPPYRPYYDRHRDGHRRPPAWSAAPRLWNRVFDVVAAGPPPTAPGFIHRDYHPGQTLWDGDRLVGVVDWTTGCLGPRGIDLARMRLNLAGRYGGEVAEQFLALYRGVGVADAHHPYWDLLDACDGLLDAPEPSTPVSRAEWARFEDWLARTAAQL
ncbi:Phosphotransferase enzyme family protein [Actinopolymorpha cephalotaxi]|uniref:Aminoglycoside phosphotransferase (APT) family kinase protein n=1 Tax=Actinopolymorpha cephalotaxi TaxID=504797 RepID=A0A1I2PHM7_9ACTN|nr:phosphotransferase [Actinopolymorpha cephalotaxi]NYH83604.1 aminoglycoside phosphotransferase (APT) family kinase protein [Actinopolymorpha cephalotaxi]SFG15588.1 Phosphotransferase enzyme family protein [Actinopolymorpha cephalotaxi]